MSVTMVVKDVRRKAMHEASTVEESVATTVCGWEGFVQGTFHAESIDDAVELLPWDLCTSCRRAIDKRTITT